MKFKTLPMYILIKSIVNFFCIKKLNYSDVRGIKTIKISSIRVARFIIYTNIEERFAFFIY